MLKKADIMDIALLQASKSPMKKQYGCVIVHRNTIIGIGYNYTLSNQPRSCVL